DDVGGGGGVVVAEGVVDRHHGERGVDQVGLGAQGGVGAFLVDGDLVEEVAQVGARGVGAVDVGVDRPLPVPAGPAVVVVVAGAEHVGVGVADLVEGVLRLAVVVVADLGAQADLDAVAGGDGVPAVGVARAEDDARVDVRGV